MVRKLVVMSSLFILMGGLALAQDEYKIELSPYVGYTTSGGVRINPVNIGDGRIVDRITPTSGVSFGVGFDYLFSEHGAIGFNFSQQQSELEGRVQGSGKERFTDMSVRNYHGIFTYNVGDEDSPMRPFFFGGLGATQYSPSEVQGQSVDSSTRFSTTWGGGVKFFVSESFGIRGTGRWTPTYIRSDPGGTWCSPFWPWNCWVVSDPHYSHQFEMSVGATFRF